MKELKVGVIGNGFVGEAISFAFSSVSDLYIYDTDPFKSLDDLESVHNCDFVFICVPTPMFEDGECDISIVESVIDDVAKEAEFQNKKVIVILKSTVPPGTTKTLNGMSPNVGVVFSPEFLTEANAISDFANQTRVVLGIDYVELVDPIIEIFKKGLPNAENIVINSDEAEMTKYTTNLFLATKVSFFNDIYTF